MRYSIDIQFIFFNSFNSILMSFVHLLDKYDKKLIHSATKVGADAIKTSS